VSGKATLKNFKTMLAEAKLPESTVMICLRGDLAADHEAAERELKRAEEASADSLAGSGAGELVDRWRALVAEHPPRRDGDNGIVDSDRIGVNAETFYDAIIRACLVDPELDDDEWAQLVDALTDRQYDDIADAAWSLNRREVDIPFSHAASRMKRASSGE
jgi:hypothetical protein